MNPDDPNNPQGGGPIPADDGGQTTPEPAAPASEPVVGGGEPAPADAPAASCHCGKPSAAGTCTGCNLPEASCSCQPTA